VAFNLFGLFRDKTPAYEIYKHLVTAARNPVFYEDMMVKDTVDGRFDMILLHLFIVQQRLQKIQAMPKYLSRDVSEAMIADMDRSLREMGVGDMAVGKQVKAMATAWFGRNESYSKALGEPDSLAALSDVIQRNIFRGEEGKAQAIAAYTIASLELLSKTSDEDMVSAHFSFAEPQKYL